MTDRSNLYWAMRASELEDILKRYEKVVTDLLEHYRRSGCSLKRSKTPEGVYDDGSWGYTNCLSDERGDGQLCPYCAAKVLLER